MACGCSTKDSKPKRKVIVHVHTKDADYQTVIGAINSAISDVKRESSYIGTVDETWSSGDMEDIRNQLRVVIQKANDAISMSRRYSPRR